MSLKTARYCYRPFEYPQAFEYFKIQQESFWLPTEVKMEKDILDWNSEKLSIAEKDVVIMTLRLFTQLEIAVQDNFWNIVPKKFKKPEITLMSSGFSNMESIHQWAYSYLNDSLGLPEKEFSEFLQDPVMKAKLEYFCKKHDKVPLFLATLVFLEGVSLFIVVLISLKG
jgi:ribonucleoside-diphosphate reductase beta chain